MLPEDIQNYIFSFLPIVSREKKRTELYYSELQLLFHTRIRVYI